MTRDGLIEQERFHYDWH